MLRRVAFVLLCCQFSCTAHGQETSLPWQGWFEAGGSYRSDFTGGQSALFIPLIQNRESLLFAKAIGRLGDDPYETRIALGGRHQLQKGWNLGSWVAYDTSQSSSASSFRHLAFGFEALSNGMDVRAAAYIPLEDRSPLWSEISALISTDITGTTTVITQRSAHELAGGGIDLEVGGLIPELGILGDLQRDGQRELRAYLGGYALSFDGMGSATVGTRIRLEYRWLDIIPALPQSTLLLDTAMSWDEVRDSEFEVGVRLRIPFGSGLASDRTAQSRRMEESLDTGFRPFNVQSIRTTTETTFTPAAP